MIKNFGGKSGCMHMLSCERACISAAACRFLLTCMFARWMPRQSSSWNVTHNGPDRTNCIFNKQFKEVLTRKPFNNESVQNFRQKKLQIAANQWRHKTRPLTLFGYKAYSKCTPCTCKRKNINGTHLMEITILITKAKRSWARTTGKCFYHPKQSLSFLSCFLFACSFTLYLAFHL